MLSKSQIIWSIKEFTQQLRERQLNHFDCNIGVSGARGNGKTQIKGDKVLMSNGLWKNVEDVKIGDEVISPQKDGTQTISKVIETHNRFEEKIFDVCEATRNKRKLYSCSWNHEIPIIVPTSKRTSKDDSTPRIRGRKLVLWNAEKIFKSSLWKGSHMCCFTTTAFTIKNPINPVIEPYTLGVWLGNGHFTKSLGITGTPGKVYEEVLKYYPILRISDKKGTASKTFIFSIKGKLAEQLEDLGIRYKISGNKFIPESCFNSDIEYRKKLLAGLIDTDGTVSKTNQLSYCTKSKQLSEDIKRLVFSLGGYASIRPITKKCQNNFVGNYFEINIAFEDGNFLPLLSNKKLRIKKFIHNPRHIAIKMEKGTPQMVYGFEIDSPSKWYVTNNYMVTHNSSFLFKVFHSFKKDGFIMKKHLVYEREDIIKLLSQQQFSFCWDDEAINSGYKRDFQNKGQQELIKIITNYRDNYNIYASALPFFYSLDKALRELIFVHVHIIERGFAVVLMPLQDSIHSQDPWDTKVNTTIETRESKMLEKNPAHKFRYHKLTTFAGYIYFGKMSKKQEEKYKKIKKEKRAKAFKETVEPKQKTWYDKLFDLVLQKKLNKEDIARLCLLEGKKPSSISDQLNISIKDSGLKGTLKEYLLPSDKEVVHNNLKNELKDLLTS